MRTKKFLLNTVFAALSQFVIISVGLFLPRIFISTYGSEVNGMVTSISQFITYISLIEAGLGAAAIYSLYKPIANNDYLKINSIVYSTKKYYLKTAAVFSVLLLTFSFLYPFIIDTNVMSYYEIVIFVIVLGVGGIFEFTTMAKYRVFLTADQRVYILSIANIAATLLNFIIIYTLALLNINVIILKVVALLSFVVKTLVLYIYVKKKYTLLSFEKTSGKPLKIPNKTNALFAQIVAVISLSIPVIAVTLTTNLLEVSVFSIYNMVVMGCISLVAIFTTGMSAIFGQMYAKDEKLLLLERYNQYEFLIYSILSVVFSCLLILILPFVKIYTNDISDINYVHVTLGILFPIWGLSHTVRIPQDTMITAAGKFKEIKKFNFYQLIMFIAIPITAGINYGVMGILIAMILINIIRNFYFALFVPKHILKINLRLTSLRIVRIYFIVFINFFLFKEFVAIYISSFLKFFIASFILLILITASTIVVSLLFDRKELLKLFNLTKSFLHYQLKSN